jgi:hypothetical protein
MNIPEFDNYSERYMKAICDVCFHNYQSKWNVPFKDLHLYLNGNYKTIEPSTKEDYECEN